MNIDLASLTISSSLESIRSGDYSSLNLVEASLRQIEYMNPVINAFINITIESAVKAAIHADALQTHHPSNLNDITLLGLPLAIKDLINIAGVNTTAGSRFFSDYIPKEDAWAVLKIRMAGAVLLGKTNTHEIALGVTGVNPHFGAVRNPWNTACITGGSSSGSAAAVVCGMCLAALGTDTGGSIRIPASLCGVVGLKPTYGRVSTRGVIPLSWNLDHVGPLTRTVRDAAIMLQTIAGYDPDDPNSVNMPVEDYLANLNAGIRDLRVGWLVGDYIESSDQEVMASIDAAGQVFLDLGACVEKVNLSWLADLALVNGQMTQADAAAFHRERMEDHPDWFGVDVLKRLQNGAALTSSGYVLARRAQAEGRRCFEMLFNKFDLLLLPTTPIPAPPIEGTDAIETARQLTRFTAPFNLTGLPALSLPCGYTKDGKPIGLQIVSKHWGELELLQAGHAFEQATDWHMRRPDMTKIKRE